MKRISRNFSNSSVRKFLAKPAEAIALIRPAKIPQIKDRIPKTNKIEP